MAISRRLLLGSALAAPALAVAATTSQAATSWYPMACEPPLVPALRVASDAFVAASGIRVFVLPTSSTLLLPQLARFVQSDLVMARADLVDALAAQGHRGEGAPRPHFRGRLVLAGRQGADKAAALAGRVAVTDPLPGATHDDRAILASLGSAPKAVQGAVDTRDVAFLVASGAVDAGIVHLSEVRADPNLIVLADIPAEAAPPIDYIATTTQTPRRPLPEQFVTFLISPEGAALMSRFGLEYAA